jgi:hypothetical protein
MNAMLYCLSSLHKRADRTRGGLNRWVADTMRLGRLNQLKSAMKVRLQAGICYAAPRRP